MSDKYKHYTREDLEDAIDRLREDILIQTQKVITLRAALKPFVKENYFTTEIYKDRDEQKSLYRMVVTKKELDAAAAAIRSDGDE